jgi:WD40 repeat protein
MISQVTIVIWDISTGEKVQVISCGFHGPIGAVAWIPELPGQASGFAFGCTDGTIHVYQRVESSVCNHHPKFAKSNIHY